jgi:O-antigen/teichoic acid export membrane protein
VAYYATPYEMVTKLLIISGALISSLYPAFAASNNKDANHTLQLLSKSIAATFIIIFPIVLIIVTFSHEGLIVWLGIDFANNSAAVLQWLASGVFINCLAQVFFALIQGRGRPDLTAKIHLLELIFYVPLLWWALKYYGIVGASFAWALRVTVDGILLLCVTKSLIPFTRKTTFKISICVIVASLALSLCGLQNSLKARAILFGVTCLIFSVFILLYLRRNGALGIMPPKVSEAR